MSSKSKKNTRNYIAKKYVKKYKENHPCVKCGENNYEELTFHHLRDKKYTIHRLLQKRASISKIKREIEKCIILCKDCHRREHKMITKVEYVGIGEKFRHEGRIWIRSLFNEKPYYDYGNVPYITAICENNVVTFPFGLPVHTEENNNNEK